VTVLKLGVIASISHQLTLLALFRNLTREFVASSYDFCVSFIDLYARLVFRLSVSFPFQDISISALSFIFIETTADPFDCRHPQPQGRDPCDAPLAAGV
jgi:hypothetical protein